MLVNTYLYVLYTILCYSTLTCMLYTLYYTSQHLPVCCIQVGGWRVNTWTETLSRLQVLEYTTLLSTTLKGGRVTPPSRSTLIWNRLAVFSTLILYAILSIKVSVNIVTMVTVCRLLFYCNSLFHIYFVTYYQKCWQKIFRKK